VNPARRTLPVTVLGRFGRYSEGQGKPHSLGCRGTDKMRGLRLQFLMALTNCPCSHKSCSFRSATTTSEN
jgi:hypothetical protein